MIGIVGSVWIASSILLAPVFGGVPALADRRERTSNVIPLFPPIPPVPSRLSPRAGLTTSHTWRRARHALLGNGWLVGLLLGGVFCVAFTVLTRGHYVTWTGVHDIPTGAR